jgi:3-hydroxyisobutyrate dehydrogenase-like beta-hydroxyacid dehydrogenase
VQIAVLGMGRMGHALAERLLESGHDLTVWNRTPHKADDLVARGVSEAGTATRAAAGAEATFTSLADDSAVLAVVTGPEGVAAGLGGGVLCDASTVSPQTTARLREAVEGRMLASPILGSPAAVVSGSASYLIGGPSEHYDWLRPAYDALAEDERRRYLGDDATVPTTLKLLANYLLMSGIATLTEVVVTAQTVGLGDDLIRDFFGQLPLVAPGLRNRLDAIVVDEQEGWFSMRLGAKDVRLADALARSHGVQLPLAGAVKRLYERAASEGWAEADIAAVREAIRVAR